MACCNLLLALLHIFTEFHMYMQKQALEAAVHTEHHYNGSVPSDNFLKRSSLHSLVASSALPLIAALI